MARIKNADDLKSVLDEAEIEMAQRLMDHDAFVVWQRWANDPKDTEPELHGPETGGVFTSFLEALAMRDIIHAEGQQAAGWIAIHGEPHTLVVPIWRRGE